MFSGRWQLNDNWPVASWSSIDYFGNWKQLHYHAKRFYAPILVTAIRKMPDTVDVRASSDSGETVCGNIILSLYKVTGELVSQRKIAIDLAPYSAAVLETIPLQELTQTPAEDFLYLEFDNGTFSCTNECFLARYKEYQLPQVQIQHKIRQGEDCKMHLELTADKPAFYVFAEFKGIKALFSDNSFTLLPGKKRFLTFETEGEYTVDELEKPIVVRHLRASYEE